MKKFYTLAAALLTVGALHAADALSFLDGETTIANGETITFSDVEFDPEYPEDGATFAPDLYLTTNYNTGKLTAIAQCTTGQEISFCFGGNCMAGETVTKEHDGIQPGERLPLMYDVIFFDATSLDYAFPVVSTILSVTDESNPSTATTMTVVFDRTNSIKTVETGKHVTVANGTFAYILDEAATLNVYNTAGVRVFSTALEGNGSLTAPLAQGLYIYTLGNETGKFIVR